MRDEDFGGDWDAASGTVEREWQGERRGQGFVQGEELGQEQEQEYEQEQRQGHDRGRGYGGAPRRRQEGSWGKFLLAIAVVAAMFAIGFSLAHWIVKGAMERWK